MNPPRTCPICAERLRGRADKKFCSDYCRNRHHNQLNQSRRRAQNEVNRILRRNRRLLEKFHSAKLVLRRDMEISNFDFRHFTHFGPHKDGKNYFFCYEYGYHLSEGELVTIVSSTYDLQTDS